MFTTPLVCLDTGQVPDSIAAEGAPDFVVTTIEGEESLEEDVERASFDVSEEEYEEEDDDDEDDCARVIPLDGGVGEKEEKWTLMKRIGSSLGIYSNSGSENVSYGVTYEQALSPRRRGENEAESTARSKMAHLVRRKTVEKADNFDIAAAAASAAVRRSYDPIPGAPRE